MSQSVFHAVDNKDGIASKVFCGKNAIERILARKLESTGESFGLGMVFHASECSLVELGVGDESEEFLIALEATELFCQLFHSVDWVHRV